MTTSERCVVINRRPAGCISGALYMSQLRMTKEGDTGTLEDLFDFHLPEDAQQMAILEGHQLIRTLGNRLLYFGAPSASTRALFSEEQLDDRCTYLLQVGPCVVIILKLFDHLQVKTFNADVVSDNFNGLEFLGVSMIRFSAMSGRILRTEEGQRFRLAIAGRDFNVSGVDEFPGWGVLLVDFDSNNVLHNACFRSMFVSYETRLCLRADELLVWREGDLANVLSLNVDFDDDARPQAQVNSGATLGDRSSNFVAEVNGEVVAVFRRLARSPTGVCRMGFVCYRLDERLRWTELCHKADSFAYSVCVTGT
ncbi:hypothetical protein BIW11_08452 [Tropilaelaps mercedesae]|uniref:Uncharacterized protein n=1 Tax=Tropilaelaps mercedesae TaxID=418985 RepID=A0A1V9XPS0_9ACAR|nr:hypothetical protein BIW11_08452 [Tropilaelaps mercedesae]